MDMSKGYKYWSDVYNEVTVYSPRMSANRLFKRYGFQRFNTHGQKIWNRYYVYTNPFSRLGVLAMPRGDPGEGSHSAQIVINEISRVLRGYPVYKGGDIHTILRVIRDRTGADISNFNYRKPHISSRIFSFFFCRPEPEDTDSNSVYTPLAPNGK